MYMKSILTDLKRLTSYGNNKKKVIKKFGINFVYPNAFYFPRV